MFSFKNYLAVTTLEEAYNELLKNKKNIVLGGTSYLRMGNVSYNTAIDLSNLALNYIREEGEYIYIGAMTSFRDLETNEITQKIFDGILDKCVRGIIGVQFRTNVTVGATVFSKYGFSDLIPTLLSMGATVVLYNGGEISLEEYLKEEGLRRDILVEVKVRKDGRGSFQSIRKSKTDYAITNVCVTKTEAGIRAAIGVRPGKAVLSYRAMDILNSNEITDEIIDKACEAMSEEISFGSNMRGTGEYRRAVSKNLLKRAIKEVL
ncbi:FAD binding domain-containing protein [Fusobacterium sp. HC1336]|uniref:FAD binding domain-containing protein n=1 Tax=Fusobacterium sp. HC1336 TaxID=3171169 RepID=UPI003F2198B4